jgi:hypothetical protein
MQFIVLILEIGLSKKESFKLLGRITSRPEDKSVEIEITTSTGGEWMRIKVSPEDARQIAYKLLLDSEIAKDKL